MEGQQNSFRSGYINSVTALFDSAERMARDSDKRTEYNRRNYKGQLLDKINREEGQLKRRNLAIICEQLNGLRDRELELLARRKEDELLHPCKDILENLESLRDIITEEELQIYADDNKDSEMVQRRIVSIAKDRKMFVNTYPGHEKKAQAVKEIASAYSSFVMSGNFGMEPAIYEERSLHAYDDILEPVEGGGR